MADLKRWAKMKELPFTILRVDSWAEIPVALEAMIKDIENRVIPAQRDGKPWDCIRLELEPHNGRFIAYPAHSEEEFRVDVTGCQLRCREIENEYIAAQDALGFPAKIEEFYQRMIALATPAFERLSCGSFQIWDADGEQR